MITHIVMWNLKDEALGASKEENKLVFKQKLEELTQTVPGIEYLEVGLKGEKSPETNHDIILISKFQSWDDLKTYAEHPNHVKVVDFVKQIVESRAAIDYES
ncbi:MAG: Dabb family protein [Bacteroidales bacterium]